MANSVDPDQTAPKEQFDLGLHCLLSYICPNIDGTVNMVNLFFKSHSSLSVKTPEETL